MELDQLKNNWNEHNTLLKKNLALNEAVLKNMKLDKAKGALKLPYVAELLALIFLLFGALFFATKIYTFKEDPFNLSLGILLVVLLLGGALIAWAKLKAIMRIDFYTSEVLKLQEDLVNFKKRVIRLIPYETLLIIGIFICSPIFFKVIRGKDLFELHDPTPIYVTLAIAFFVIAPLGLWLIPKLYVSKIKEATARLEEIEKFRSESE